VEEFGRLKMIVVVILTEEEVEDVGGFWGNWRKWEMEEEMGCD